MLVTEIFKTIHGESSYAGLPCTLVRLTGCNLRCHFCDATHAFANGKEMTINQVVDSITKLNIKNVLITGGEPLLQKEANMLSQCLMNMDYNVVVETNGTQSISHTFATSRIVDVKTPSSGHAGSYLKQNNSQLTHKDEIKFVISDRLDYNWSVNFIKDQIPGFYGNVLFSPNTNSLDAKVIAGWLIEDGYANIRLNIQLHKIIWGKSTTM